MPDKVIVLNEGAPWGFRMTGGKNTGSPLKISRVNNAGKAAKAGVREGFLIESINSAPVDHLTSNEAQALIRNSGDTLTIGVYRPSKSHITKQNNEDQKAETKACVDKSGGSKQQSETETTIKKSKRVRKRRRKKKRAEFPEQLNDHEQPKKLPVKIVEQNQEQSRVPDHSKIEIIPATPGLQVDELEWIKKNEALLIAELETRRQAGLPIQVVVEVEKIVPSKPEYCQIIPDFCHLEVIKEETSATSDEDRNRDILQCREENQKSNGCKELSDDWNAMDVGDGNICESDNILEVDFNDTMQIENHLERLESPSLVRDSEILKFADEITSENNFGTELDETIKTLNNTTINIERLELNEHFEPQMVNVLGNNLNNGTYNNDYDVEGNKVDKDQKQYKNDENKINNNNNYYYNNNNTVTNSIGKHDRLQVSNAVNSKEIYSSHVGVYHQENYFNNYSKDEHVNNVESFFAKPLYNKNYSTINDYKYNGNVTKNNEYNLKNVEAPRLDDTEQDDQSSDDSTIKQYQPFNYKYKTRGQNKVSLNDKLKQIARFLQDDTTDDYEELQSSRKTSRCVSVASDADVDTDWVSFTLSDGESSKSLCLSPSQMKSGRAPSTASETSEIIDLHRKFLDRTKTPNLSPHRDAVTPVEILSYSESPSTSPAKSRHHYTSEVFDEACRMCGTSDEPLSDAECLVSLRKYRETRSRLLDVIQREQHHQQLLQLDRSAVIDRQQPLPPPPPSSKTMTTSSMSTFIDTLSVPDNRTRELMYTEYMEKVKEREQRLQNKVIRITKSGRPLSSGTLQALNDIDAEFLTKARERLEKLGAASGEDADFRDDEYYPKHLVDIVPAEEVCVEEVQMINGVWSPELKHKSSPEVGQGTGAPRRTRPDKTTQPSLAELPPVWTPGSSPTPERKTYKPVRFESPTLSRKKINAEFHAKIPPKSPTQSPALSLPPPPPPPPTTALPLKTQGDENVHSTDRRLPRVQSPTVTLLQKAREGQLPKGSAYLDTEEYNMDKENKNRGSSVKRNVESEERRYALRYDDRQSDEKKPKKMVEISPKKYEGIGPTTKEGVPIVLRSEVKETNQPRWYKQMYESLHKFQSDDPKAKHGDGYLSEPEKGYESDYAENRLFQNGGQAKHVSIRRSVSPVKCGQDRYKNQPRPIENYEPGHSSIAEKEAKHFWDEVMNNFDGNYDHQVPPPKNRSSSKKSNLAQALKESGYDSDSTLVFKRRENQPECLSPTEQKTAYKVIQNGGEIPFQGLRKTVPDRPKDSPHKYTESEVTLQYRRPVRSEIKEEWSEEELANKQAEAMRRIYQEERRRKYLQELQDMSNRRHADNLLPSQKSPIPLNRYDDFLDESPQPPRSRTPEPKLVARALYNFVGQTSRELSFRKGDIIFVRKQVDKNWYEGEHNAMVGLFPFNYVEVIPYDGIRTTPHRPYEGQARAKFNFMAQTNMELSLVKGELVVLTRRVDNNWYEGRIGSRKGIFPVSYVTVLVEPGDHPNASIGTPFKPVASPAAHSLITSNPPKTQHMYQPDSYNTPMPTRNLGTQTKKQINNMNKTLHVDVHSEPMPYRALYNYKPQNSDELELREGDVVFVMEKCDDGWYVGSSKRTGCFGTFPGNYVQRSV